MSPLLKRPYAVILLAFVSILVYINTLGNGFVYDDADLVLRNPWIRDPSRLPDMFLTSMGGFLNIASGTYRPMVHVAYLIEHSLFGLAPWGFHLTNVLLNALAALLVYMVASKIIDRGAQTTPYPFFAALYFTIHPAHSEVVSWVSTLAEMSFTILTLSALYLHIRGAPSLKKALASTFFFFWALLFKETAVAFIPLALLYDISLKERRFEGLSRYIPYVIAAAAYFALRSHAVKMAVPGKLWFDLTPFQYLLNVIRMVPFYFQKLAFPVNLTAYYYIEPVKSALDPRAMASMVFVAALVVLMAVLWRRQRQLFFSLAWVMAAIAPTLYLPGLGKSFFADRYLYLPSVGFVLFVALLCKTAIERFPALSSGKGKAIVILAGLTAATLLTAQTIKRNTVWKDSRALWTDAVEKYPEAPLPHYNLGLVHANDGETSLAIEEFRKAVEADPDYADARYNLAVMYETAGMEDSAIREYAEAIRIKPRSADAHLNLGILLKKKGATELAAKELRLALEIDPSLSAARAHLEEIPQNEVRH